MQLINCVIMNTTLTNAQLEHCILVSCELQGCELMNSSIDNSSIKTSKIVDSKFTNCLRSKCDVTPTPPFNRIPPEIRVMIMSKVINWRGKIPVLIAALRGDPVLYREALGVLHRNYTFKLHLWNESTRKQMSRAAFQSIEKLEVV